MSETTNLKLFKHDNPSTNTNPFDVEQSLNENWDKIDTEIGNIRENINGNDTDITDLKSKVTDLETNLDTAQNNIDEIKQEQITQNKVIEANTTAIEENTRSIEQNTTDITKLQEDNAKLKAQIPTGTAAGEEISLSDSAEMELVDFGLQGNSYQEVEDGKNKAIIPDREETFKEMSINIKNGIINITGKSSGTHASYRIVGSAELEAGKTYYLRLFGNKSGSASLRNDTKGVWFPDSENNENQFTPTVGGTYNIQLGFGGGENQNWNARYSISETSNADWVEGKEPKPTLENQSKIQAVGDDGSVKIVKSNKNLLSFEYKTGNGITFDKNRITIIDPTGYLYAGKTLVGGNSFLSGKKVIFTTISNGTISGTLDFTVHTNKVQYRFQKKHTTGTYNNDITSQGFMFANDEYITSIFVYTTGATSNLTIDVQVSIADEDFIEHEGNTYTIPVQKPFYKIGDYADKFIKQDGKWYEQHYIKEYIFTGNENWFDGGTTTNNQYIWSNPFEDANKSILGNYNDDIVSPVLSNYFISIGNRPNNAGSVGISFVNFTNGETHLRVGVGLNSEYNTLELFKQKLQELNAAGTPVKMYYILSTPELIECTSEQTQILEQIIKDGTYKEVTHFYTKEDLKPTIELTYYKDLETLFNKQAELENTLNNVQAQILELGGN